MITNFSLARTERSLSLLLRCFALLCVVLTLALAIAPVFVRLVAQFLPLLSLSMLLVWLVVVLLLLLVLDFLRFLSLQSSFFTSCPAFLLSSGFCNAVADWGFSDAVASTLVLLLLLLNFLLLPTLTAWHCCSCLCCVSFVAFNASWYC